MNNSKSLREWQKDLIYLACTYNITPSYCADESADIFTLVSQASRSFSDEMKEKLGQQTADSIACFLETTADSFFAMSSLLKTSLNKNLITIDEYYRLSKSLYEIGETIKKLIDGLYNIQNKSDSKANLEAANFAFWTLN